LQTCSGKASQKRYGAGCKPAPAKNIYKSQNEASLENGGKILESNKNNGLVVCPVQSVCRFGIVVGGYGGIVTKRLLF
jgi:hypothetical protein